MFLLLLAACTTAPSPYLIKVESIEVVLGRIGLSRAQLQIVAEEFVVEPGPLETCVALVDAAAAAAAIVLPDSGRSTHIDQIESSGMDDDGGGKNGETPR